jgi:hypothetical protein
MANLTLRVLTRAGDTTKNAPLTNAEVDTNFINLDADLDGKAGLASPAFTGTPTAPTAVAGTNTTQLATTAFVIGERNSTVTLVNKTVEDTTFTVQNTTDTTKKFKFDAASISTATTRTYTLPNITGTIATIANITQTFAGTTTFSGTFTLSGTTVNLGSSTGVATVNLAHGVTSTGNTKTVNLGTGGASGSTTNINFGSTTGTVSYTFNGTSALRLPQGNTATRPTGAAGLFRYNTETNQFEGHNGSAWGSVGGGATGGSNNPVFWENDINITANYTVTTGKNAGTFGPVSIANGISVTVPNGSVWTVV